MGFKNSSALDFIDLDEKELLKSFQQRENGVFEIIYERYVNELFVYGIGLGFERELLKDAIQDVFYKIYFNRTLLEKVTNLKFYLFRMLKNRLLDMTKSTVKILDVNQLDSTFFSKVTMLDELIQEEDRIAINTRVNKLLECLTGRQREALFLRFIQEMEYEDVAQLLNMTPQAVRKLVFRGIKRIREYNAILSYLLIHLIYFLS